ncbi:MULTISPECIES: RHS repeat domain-containing protein [unclassified Acidovorax]|uniref:RHS repeat domain-containing protein n=1 Tax=unclassified Acidovorax TaxID=2684926 RepID=UPI0009E6EDFD|nr:MULTISPECIES: RHS repeat-associated core domain-containing protein [unclassified Acidovorax]
MITALKTAMRTSMPRFVARLVLMLTLVLGTLGTASAQTVTYFHNDIAGTPMLATDAAGAVVWKENYLPYGYRQVADPASGGNKLWFTGKAYDPETQLSYMGARYYMPLLGRFTGIDPVGIVPEQPHSFNRYAYANNNPYKYVDPDGKIAETVWDAFNIALGFQSLVSNLRAGNWSGAAMDGFGIGVDGAAAAIPLVPGGAGAAISAHRAATAAKVLEDSALVCRGGECKAENFVKGSGVKEAADGTLSGVSTQSKNGGSVAELAQPFKNNQIGITTVGDIRRAGGRVTADGNSKNPNHATVDGLTGQQLEKLFSPTRHNPVPPAQRGN